MSVRFAPIVYFAALFAGCASRVDGTPYDRTSATGGAGDDDNNAAMDLRAPSSLVAAPGAGGVELTWSAPANAVGLTGYALSRDGVALISLAADATTYLDAEIAFSAPPAVTLLEAAGRAEGVQLTWPAVSADVVSHDYAVVAVYGAVGSASVTARVDAGSIVYQVQRNAENWADIGSGTSYLDVSAPPVPALLGTPTAKADFRGVVVVRLDSIAQAGAASATAYRVRARLGGLEGPGSAPVDGARAAGEFGKLVIQWERSRGTESDDFSALPGVTGELWFDETAPVDTPRWYRARVSGWAAGVSTSAAAQVASYQAVAAGGQVSCGLRADRIDCWGYGGQIGAALGVTGEFTDLAVGEEHYCALHADGSVACAGSPTSAVTPPDADRFIGLRAIGGTTCGLRTDSKVICWGAPGWTASTDAMRTFAVGRTHGCGIRLDGSATCWGENTRGQATPDPAATFSGVAVGEGFSCGIRTDGHLVCWGEPADGIDVPTTLFVSLSAAAGTVCAVADTGTVLCLGDTSSLPAMTDDFASVSVTASIQAGLPAQACGLRRDGKIRCWGPNFSGSAPALPPRESFTSVGAGPQHRCGITTAGTLVCWGENASKAPPAGQFVAVSPGDRHDCGLRADRTATCWAIASTVQLTPPSDAFTAIAAGLDAACGLHDDGSVACWGSITAPSQSVRYQRIAVSDKRFCGIDEAGGLTCQNGSAAFNFGPTSDAYVDVALSATRVCAVANDGHVACWPTTGPQPAMAGSTNSRIQVGAYTTCLLQESGDVICDQGSFPAQPGPVRAVSLSVGEVHDVCAVRASDGKMICWGYSAYGQAPAVLPPPLL